MGIARYFRCKSVEGLVAEAQKSKALTRSLSAFQLVMLGVGAIIGGGIFVFTGSAAAQHAGPAIVLSFMLAGLACACVALCYAELASMIPISGSAYTYAYASLGELPAWIIACMILLTYCLGAASVASGWSGYAQSFLADYGYYFPAHLTDSYGNFVLLNDGTSVTTFLDLPALIIVAIMTFVVLIGSKTSAWVNTIIVFIKISVLLMFVILGSTKVDPSNWQPFIPKNTGIFGEFGWSGIVAGASIIFLAYSGFDAVATAAQEAKNPRRDLPIGIIGSLIICVIIYMLVSGFLTAIVSYKELNVPEPLAIALNKMAMPWFSIIIKIGAIIGLTTVILVMTFGAVRIIYTITNDGLLPKILSKTSPKTHTPYITTIVVGIIIACLASVFSVHKLIKLANFGSLVTFIIVCIGTIYLRHKKPHVKREFRCPWVPLIPVIGVILLAGILFSLPAETYLHASIWVLFMLVVYFGYGSKNSHLLHPRK